MTSFEYTKRLLLFFFYQNTQKGIYRKKSPVTYSVQEIQGLDGK